MNYKNNVINLLYIYIRFYNATNLKTVFIVQGFSIYVTQIAIILQNRKISRTAILEIDSFSR